MFSDIFVQLLQKNEIKPYRVAKDLGIPKSIVYEWKDGKREPSADKLLKLAEYFGVSVSYLLGAENNVDDFADTDEKELILLLRATKEISETDHNELVSAFKKNLDMYLRARIGDEYNGDLGV